MPRHLAIGNGRMLVNFDAGLNMRDLYYPHVGMLNHICGHRNALGVWVDEKFSWVDSPCWQRRVAYEEETMVTAVRSESADLQVALTISDAVHFREDLYLKRVLVENQTDRSRELRIFFTHDFCIDQTDIGDTALYDPSSDAVIHYKRDKSFLISGSARRQGIYQYATGTKRFGGAEGTWRDAEDGWLEGNPIAQGSVDSTISFRLHLPARGQECLDYWIAAGESFSAVRRLAALVQQAGVQALLDETRTYWRSWVNKRRREFRDLSPEVVDLFKRSLLVVRTQIDRGGAILAANDSDILQYNRDHYSYMWPRDGALVAYALDSAGYSEVTRPFYNFCREVLAPGGFLWHKYNPDGSVGSSWHPWIRDGDTQLPIQEDETALVLLALWQFYEKDRDIEFLESLYGSFIRPAADFLARYRDAGTNLPLDSYDLWEERRGVFTFTCATVWSGLCAAARFAALFGQKDAARSYERAADEVKQGILEYLYSEELGRFIRGYYVKPDGTRVVDSTLESSLFGIFAFGVLPADDPRVVGTMEAIAEGLWVKTAVGGVARYSRDYYFQKSGDFERVPGNPWVICTLWLAHWHIAKARTWEDLKPARELLTWTTERALPSGVLSEQIHPETGEPVSVAPLTWSHSTFILTVVKYLRKAEEIEKREALAAAWHASPS